MINLVGLGSSDLELDKLSRNFIIGIVRILLLELIRSSSSIGLI